MIIESSRPKESDTQLYINAGNLSYFVSERGEGKTAETLRQAISRCNVIVCPYKEPYRTYGFQEFSKIPHRDYKITYLDVAQMDEIDSSTLEDQYTEDHPLEICVDEGRLVLEELLREKLGVPVKINFMSLDTGENNDE